MLSFTALLALLVAAVCCITPSSAQSNGQILLGFDYDFTASSIKTGGGEASFDLHCNPPQQFTTLPATGAPLTSFQTYVDLSQTNVAGVIRFALYTVSATNVYTLVAGTNNASDIAVAPNTAAVGPTLVSTTASLYFPTGTSYTVMPNTNYSICFLNTGGWVYVPGTTTNGTIFMYHWVEQVATSNVVLVPYYLSQPLPNPLVPSGTSASTWQIWMSVTTPVITWKFVYGLQGNLSSAAGTQFSVCTVGTFLTSTTAVAAGRLGNTYQIYQMYGTRTFTNATYTVTNNIIGLAPLGADGNDDTLYPSSYPYVSGGGITYALDDYAMFPGGGATGGTDPYYTAQTPFVNAYNNSGSFFEDAFQVTSTGFTTQIGSGFVLSPANSNNVYSCAVLTGAAPVAPGGGSSSGAAAPASSSSSRAAVVNGTSSSSAAAGVVASSSSSAAAVARSSSSSTAAAGGVSSSSSSSSAAVIVPPTPSSSTAAVVPRSSSSTAAPAAAPTSSSSPSTAAAPTPTSAATPSSSGSSAAVSPTSAGSSGPVAPTITNGARTVRAGVLAVVAMVAAVVLLA